MARRCRACNEFDVVFKRPAVCISSFTITMIAGCHDFTVVPQVFKDRLNDFAENFLVIEDCHGFKYDVHIQVGRYVTTLCGAYWRLFAWTHQLKAGDKVRFSAADYGTCFEAVLVGQDNDVVLDANLFGLPEVSYDVRLRLSDTIFKNMADLTDREVKRVCKAIGKVEFIPCFECEVIVQKMTDVDMASEVLVIPCKCKNVLRVPFSGHATLNSAKLTEPMDAVFTTSATGDILICKGWEEFCNSHRIRVGSVLLLVVDKVEELGIEVQIIKR